MMMLSTMQWSSSMFEDEGSEFGFERYPSAGRMHRGQDLKSPMLQAGTQRQSMKHSHETFPSGVTASSDCLSEVMPGQLTPTEMSEYLHELDPHVMLDQTDFIPNTLASTTLPHTSLPEKALPTEDSRFKLLRVAQQLSEQQRLQALAQRRTEEVFRELVTQLKEHVHVLQESFQNVGEGPLSPSVSLEHDADCSVAVFRFAWHHLTFLWFPHTKPLLVIPQEDAHVTDLAKKAYTDLGASSSSEAPAPFFAGRIMVLRGAYDDMMDSVNGSLEIQDVLPFELGSCYIPSNPETLPCLFRVAFHERPEDTLLTLSEGLEACVFQFMELLAFGGYLHE
ncbi:MAG: hypothetical protein ACKO37_09275 [Vampirovibrionales bacterium]